MANIFIYFLGIVLTAILSKTPAEGLECCEHQELDEIEDCQTQRDCQQDEWCHIRKYVSKAGKMKYDLGCMSDWFCAKVFSFLDGPWKRYSEIVLWNRCCDSTFCNKNYNTLGHKIESPGYYRIPTGDSQCTSETKDKFDVGIQFESDAMDAGLRCLECDHVDRPDDCLTTVTCQPGEMCTAGKFKDGKGNIAYRLGCKTAVVCKTENIFQSLSSDKFGRRGSEDVVYKDWFACCSENECNRNLCPDGHCSTTIMTTPSSSSPSTTTTTTTSNLLTAATAATAATTTTPAASSTNQPVLSGLTCVKCTNQAATNCRLMAECYVGEVCYSEKTSTGPPYPSYTSGCLDRKVCTDKAKSRGSQPDSCFLCCEDPWCNYGGCGEF